MTDFDRPLSDQGERDAPRIGEKLARAGFVPDLLLTSTARRAQRTSELLAAALDLPPERIRPEPAIYEAGATELISLLRSLRDSGLEHVALVGHNPTLTDAARWLCEERVESLPSGGVVRIEVDAADWQDLRPGCGRLVRFDAPKDPPT